MAGLEGPSLECERDGCLAELACFTCRTCVTHCGGTDVDCASRYMSDWLDAVPGGVSYRWSRHLVSQRCIVCMGALHISDCAHRSCREGWLVVAYEPDGAPGQAYTACGQHRAAAIELAVAYRAAYDRERDCPMCGQDDPSGAHATDGSTCPPAAY